MEEILSTAEANVNATKTTTSTNSKVEKLDKLDESKAISGNSQGRITCPWVTYVSQSHQLLDKPIILGDDPINAAEPSTTRPEPALFEASPSPRASNMVESEACVRSEPPSLQYIDAPESRPSVHDEKKHIANNERPTSLARVTSAPPRSENRVPIVGQRPRRKTGEGLNPFKRHRSDDLRRSLIPKDLV